MVGSVELCAKSIPKTGGKINSSMRGFQANNCRLCQKVFCCRKCRMKHEKNVHKVFPDCDICIVGKFFFANFDENFLKHLESSHLPVCCVYCKKVFSSVEDILQHKKCDFLQTKDVSPKTPFKGTPPALLVSTDDHDSPILQELQRQEYLNYILATSTPMQRGEEPNLMFEKSKEVITPVDKPPRAANKSIIKKTHSAQANEQLSKRRVTFGEIATANTLEKNIRESITGEPELLSSNKVSESLDCQSSDQKLNGNFTPDMGMITGQFYSAKTETDTQFYSAKTDVSSKSAKDSDTKMSAEGFTPVGVPNRSKLINVKGDIYKKQDQGRTLNSSEYFNKEENIKTDNLEEVSMELCTPALNTLKPLNNFPNGQKSVCQEPENIDISTPLTKNLKGTQENETKHEFITNLSTPAKTSNSGKIVVKGDIYKNSEQENVSQVAEVTKLDDESGSNDDHSKSKDVSIITKQDIKAATIGQDTLWLSAINVEELNDFEQQNENKSPDKPKPTQDEINPFNPPSSPQRNDQRRVSIVMPTPILKTTNVQMKFHFPAHLSSTPIIMSSGRGAAMVGQTDITTDISTRAKLPQTPYKTVPSNLYELVQRQLVDANLNLRQNLASLPDTEAIPSTSHNDIVRLENKDDFSVSNTGGCKDIVREPMSTPYENTFSSISSCEPETHVSVSSMTESNLWTSMTRLVKSVFGFTSQDSSYISMNSSTSKRQLSDSDTSDFLEAPRLKRFKFTDIKCRRAIRDLPAIELPRSLPAPAPPIGSIEIVKSVSTLYGRQTMIIQCDKATQTDNYLMYGWHPQ